jgi:succinate-semialdehyde dehydrogenase/glutarate-semialdehyde dehydrogenase
LSIETSWANMPKQEKSELLTKVADLLLDRKVEYAELIPKEMGKPILQSISEIEKCPLVRLSKSLFA